jgi:hypothetical protein
LRITTYYLDYVYVAMLLDYLRHESFGML